MNSLCFTFLSPKANICGTCATVSDSRSLSRRSVLTFCAVTAVTALHPSFSRAAMYSADVASPPKAKGDPESISTYLPQLEAGRAAIADLLKNWEAKTASYDGDTVRRVLGTVGVTSPLFNVRKAFFKVFSIVAQSGTLGEADIEQLDSEWNAVVDGISSVDYQAYSVSFTELAESKDNLLRLGKRSLEETLAHYDAFLDGIQPAIN